MLRRTSGPAATPCDRGRDAAERVDKQTVLFRFTDQLFRSRTLSEIYDAALDAICSALLTTRASILRFDRDGTMRFVAWRGLSDDYRTAVNGHSPWQRSDRGAPPIFFEDVNRSGLEPQLAKTISAEGIRSLAFIPLAGSAELVGKFMVYYDAVRIFSEEEREIAVTIARQLGFAIEREASETASRRLMALIDSSDDAIIAKDLNGIITDWNPAAERIFGYRRDEAIGQSIMLLIPEARREEEPAIIERIRAGQHIKHYETVRQHKDGSMIDISLTVSPIKDADGKIIGASKIARDIADRKLAQEQQLLLLREMNHRVKNIFALTSGIVNLSVRSAKSVDELASTVTERLAMLARVHNLTLSPLVAGDEPAPTTLHCLISAVLSPYQTAARARFDIRGADTAVPSNLVTSLSLLLHEFATNAAKYGSLSTLDGMVEIVCADEQSEFILVWRESGGPPPQPTATEGFGSRLVKATTSQLGRINRVWEPSGAVIELAIEKSRLTEQES
ncbi:MAG TPA: PAS domain S-box protein, partial [Ensifer sp.]|uniref:PAS domain S-box protein n=1 Tax=Ensifer sp. TaxID=1872086 RepID=UPI002E11AF78|nr:PAS domain S-box protein [Ensifer sp.]